MNKWRQVEVNGVKIEGSFETADNNLIHTTIHQRDISQLMPKPKITQSRAHEIVGGKITDSQLYLGMPGSKVLTHPKCQERPHWVVSRKEKGGNEKIILLDAITGDITGCGTPPPSGFCSITGPVECPNKDSWFPWSENARDWFLKMGLQGNSCICPPIASVAAEYENINCVAYYELAHGNQTCYMVNCTADNSEIVTDGLINLYLQDKPKIPFSFFGSCHALDKQEQSSLSWAARKGLSRNTCVVGFRKIGEPGYLDGWINAYPWQDRFFSYLALGQAVKYAWDDAITAYPMCASIMGFEGDPTYAPPFQRSFIKLNVDKTRFSQSDRIIVTADIDPVPGQFNPYIRLTGNGQTLFVTRKGLVKKSTPFLQGPFFASKPIYDQPICNTTFKGVSKGQYKLEAALVGVQSKKVLGNVYSVGLEVV